MIRVVHPGSGSWFFTHPGSRGQKAPDPGSGTLECTRQLRMTSTCSQARCLYLVQNPQMRHCQPGPACTRFPRMNSSRSPASSTRDRWASQQCCGSGMFIPDPGSWVLPIPDSGSRIPDPGSKNSTKKLVVKPFFVATNFTKFYFLNAEEKNLGQFSKKFLPKNLALGSKKWAWDPGSGKKPIPDPGPGVKKAPDPGSRSATLHRSYIIPIRRKYRVNKARSRTGRV